MSRNAMTSASSRTMCAARSPSTISQKGQALGMGRRFLPMTEGQPVNLSVGLPETVLPAEPPEARDALAAALVESDGDRRAAVAIVVARWPRFLAAWATLGELARDDVE